MRDARRSSRKDNICFGFEKARRQVGFCVLKSVASKILRLRAQDFRAKPQGLPCRAGIKDVLTPLMIPKKLFIKVLSKHIPSPATHAKNARVPRLAEL